MNTAPGAVVSVKKLRTAFRTRDGVMEAVRGISFDVGRGDILGIVGESGSGKTVTAMSILRLLPSNGFIAGGEIVFDGTDLASASTKTLRGVRGGRIAMVFQDPMSSLNPLMPIGRQIEEMILEHRRGLRRSEVRQRVINLLNMMHIPSPENRYGAYPHEFSGGMRQRVMIAMALACEPDMLIADEPTTALDVTIQEQILILLRKLRAEFNLSILFITHDLCVVADLCTRVIVMYGGMIMEEASADDIFDRPAHPYTMGLLASAPNLSMDKTERLASIPGSPPDMTRPPKGCPFSPRCQYAMNVCVNIAPPMYSVGASHRSSCWLLSPDAPPARSPLKAVAGDVL
ncbi:MAG: ABC transporter ATP-binding protein [Synergistaceae bacterium]|jgi:oligopeptide transport system ATP-binding protein|nr:ABC transporter ATP-binding protein [Synergistaceae bacterium]